MPHIADLKWMLQFASALYLQFTGCLCLLPVHSLCRDCDACRWGLVPSFTKPGDKLDHFRMVRAWEAAQQMQEFELLACVCTNFLPCPLPPYCNTDCLCCDDVPICTSVRSDARHFDQHSTSCLQLACAALQFNARSETVAEKGIFKRLLPSMRCIVLVNGFYEWKKASCA